MNIIEEIKQNPIYILIILVALAGLYYYGYGYGQVKQTLPWGGTAEYTQDYETIKIIAQPEGYAFNGWSGIADSGIITLIQTDITTPIDTTQYNLIENTLRANIAGGCGYGIPTSVKLEYGYVGFQKRLYARVSWQSPNAFFRGDTRFWHITCSGDYLASTNPTVSLSGYVVFSKTKPECPPCPEPSEWSECIGGYQYRTVYKCDETTGYECVAVQEKRSCVVAPVCGNGICEEGEDYINCPEDCPAPPVCGNGICEEGETEENCPEDCAVQPSTTGYIIVGGAIFMGLVVLIIFILYYFIRRMKRG